MVHLLFQKGSCPNSGIASLPPKAKMKMSFRRTSSVAGRRPCLITVLVLEIVAETGHRDLVGREEVQWKGEQDKLSSLENRK